MAEAHKRAPGGGEGSGKPEPPATAPPFVPGTRIGRYELAAELASGGMAKVLLARVSGDAGFEKLVAVKRIHPHLAERSDFVEMFMDEARLAARITHPNVCSVFDFGVADGSAYLAMEYLAGETLGRLYRRVSKQPERLASPRWWAVALRLVSEAAEGLHAAHELRNDAGELLQVVHRDVSPANVFVTYDGAVKVVDFGVARANERTHQTAHGQIKGHYAYMAPEYARGRECDRRADLWSLGVVLFELLAGARMIERGSDAAILIALLAGDFARLEDVRPGLPPEVYALVNGMLSMEPTERPASAREVSRTIERILVKFGEPVTRSDVEELMGELFAAERERRLALMGEARRGRGEGARSSAGAVRAPSTPAPLTPASGTPSTSGLRLGNAARAPSGEAELSVSVEVAGLEDDEAQGLARGGLDTPRNRLIAAALAGLVLVTGGVYAMTSADPAPPPPVERADAAVRRAPPPREARPPSTGGSTTTGATNSGATTTGATTAGAATTGAATTGAATTGAATTGAATTGAATTGAATTGAATTGAVVPPPRLPDARPVGPGGAGGTTDRRPPPTTPPAAPSAPGRGFLNLVTPGGWAEVFEDRTRIGRTPTRLELPSGRHTLELRPFGTGTPRRVTVSVRAGGTTRRSEPITP